MPPLLHVGAVYHHEFQSTRPMRGATTLDDLRGSGSLVSIHAPHAGRDLLLSPISARPTRFNPRAPCGARLMVFCRQIVDKEFQSTRPMRGATFSMMQIRSAGMFQSTRPMRGATGMPYICPASLFVSIHAPHAGRDATRHSSAAASWGFNPRAPCGARQLQDIRNIRINEFQSTRPVWGATGKRRCLSRS